MATAAVLFGTSVESLTYTKRTDGSAPKALHMPIQRRETSRPVVSNALRKRNTVSETLDNFENGALYFANVTIGTPPQQFSFHIDTGSSDLWANVKNSKLCRQDAETVRQGGVPCSVSGTYDNTTSSTAKFVNNNFQIQYADGTGAQGPYLTDVVRFGQVTIQNQQFGVGTQSSSSEGVMGIGFPELETAVQTAHENAYNNIPQQMVAQGLIGTAAYSLWLDDLYSSTGNILFGGVDTDKFSGQLKTLPIQKIQGQDLEMIVTLNSVAINDNGQSTTVLSQETPVLLDSGSTLTYLPTAAAQAIFETVGATFDQQAQMAMCSCSLANSSTALSFNFAGQNIQVTMRELVIPGGIGAADGDKGCTFGIVPQSGSQQGQPTSFTLGDSFIRNAYLVYNLGASEISIAQANFNTQSSNVQELSPSNDQSAANGVAADAADNSGAADLAPWSVASVALVALLATVVV